MGRQKESYEVDKVCPMCLVAGPLSDFVEGMSECKGCLELIKGEVPPLRQKADGWFGPEVKPKEEDLISIYYQDFTDAGIYRSNVGIFTPETKAYLDKESPYGFAAVDFIDGYVHWDWVLCWKAYDPGPIPERFKIQPLATTEQDDKNEVCPYPNPLNTTSKPPPLT